MRGFDPVFDGFVDADGSYTISLLDELTPVDALFEGPADSHLATGCSAIDSGVDPSLVDPDLAIGLSIDGEVRNAASIDRGAFEQSP